MAYIGNIPAESYASFETETFSVSATTNYTLSHAVTNENEIRLVINGVVQQPGSGKAYTASGTTLTLTSATVSGDVMYAVYLGRALQTVNPPNASVGTAQLADSSVSLAKLSATGTKDATTFLRGDNTFATAGVTGKTIRATSVVQDGSGYTLSNNGFTNFGSGLSYTPATTTSQVMAFVEVVCSAVSDSSDNDARTTIKFGTNNSSGNTIYESTVLDDNGNRNLGYVNINDPTVYNQISTTISTCQRNSSNNVVVVIGCVSNADPGTTIGMGHMKAVFMEIE